MDLLPNASLDERFELARDMLRSHYGDRGAAKSLHPLFSPSTLSRLLRSEEDFAHDTFSFSIKQRLVWLFERDEQLGIYTAIEKMMGHTDTDQQIIYRDFLGSYSLFRFVSTSVDGFMDGNPVEPGGHPNLNFVEEKIDITKDEHQEPAFHYYSHEYKNDNIIVHGAVFHGLGKLYLAGLNRDSISLGIITASRDRGWMQGFWNSTAKRGVGMPFSSRMILVKSGMKSLRDRLADRNGDRLFFDMTGGNYAYYMSM